MRVGLLRGFVKLRDPGLLVNNRNHGSIRDRRTDRSWSAGRQRQGAD